MFIALYIHYLIEFTLLEKATDCNQWPLPFKAEGALNPPSAQAVRERSSLTGFISVNVYINITPCGYLYTFEEPEAYKNKKPNHNRFFPYLFARGLALVQ